MRRMKVSIILAVVVGVAALTTGIPDAMAATTELTPLGGESTPITSEVAARLTQTRSEADSSLSPGAVSY